MYEVDTRFAEISDTLRERLNELPPAEQGLPGPVGDRSDPLKTMIRHQNGASLTVTYISSSAIGDEHRGRYRLDRVLGEGAYGRVYLGFDEELQRQVAVKVPTKARFQKPEDAEAYLAEARVVASLDHRNIVPVYDVGRTRDGSIYVVSRFVEGSTLRDLIHTARPTERESAQLLSTVAAALQNAHQKRLIHRDIKPANILIEHSSNTPFVADFGLAVREEDYLKHTGIVGTPGYMSPEQARREGHRLDGRSDIFSLGVILYELLTGEKPFRGNSHSETLQQVISSQPRPPRDLRNTIPAELERICLKALSKRASDRYATAADFAADLEQWLQPVVATGEPKGAARFVLRGLRSFDARDADFFLDLLPGPRNREGLPESIAFWKQRIEQTDSDQTFSVGLIYGPSGCGKSSLVKAGLLPHLANHIATVYVEAAPENTEIRILHALRKRLPELSEELGLVETLASLRRRDRGPKVVIVIDQFEQWLHAHRAEPGTPLVKALRQCDGSRLPAVLLVRDDFAMAAARFMSALEVPIVQGENFAIVDLFDGDHAKYVLTKFGQAFGRLPADTDTMSKDQRSFVSSVAKGLAQDGQVVCVRLTLFAEMVKHKPWTAVTLSNVGGTQGIGVNFLEETFGSRHANPRHRLHAVAARAVLRALLPESGSDLRGNIRSRAELLDAAGFGDRSRDLDDLLTILDGELRLITPTDPDRRDSSVIGGSSVQYYQLTHDCLVPSLWEWLTRKQRETFRGRMELRLAERAANWKVRREPRQLPSLFELPMMILMTRRRQRTSLEQQMLQIAARRGMGFVLITSMIVFIAILIAVDRMAERALTLPDRLITADNREVPALIAELSPSRQRLLPLLRVELAKSRQDHDERRQLRFSLAILRDDPDQVTFLADQLLVSSPEDVRLIQTFLGLHFEALRSRLWSVLADPANRRQQVLPAAACLAHYDMFNARWTAVSRTVTAQLTAQDTLSVGD